MDFVSGGAGDALLQKEGHKNLALSCLGSPKGERARVRAKESQDEVDFDLASEGWPKKRRKSGGGGLVDSKERLRIYFRQYLRRRSGRGEVFRLARRGGVQTETGFVWPVHNRSPATVVPARLDEDRGNCHRGGC
jgi:hypothetical protein